MLAPCEFMNATSNEPATLPYGGWRSSISAAAIASSAIGLDQLRVAGEDLYWIESRPAEGGRCVIVRRTAGGILADLTPPPWNVRSRVHEYGGGAYFVDDGLLCFVHHADQRIYQLDADFVPLDEERQWWMRVACRFLDVRRALSMHSVVKKYIKGTGR